MKIWLIFEYLLEEGYELVILDEEDNTSSFLGFIQYFSENLGANWFEFENGIKISCILMVEVYFLWVMFPNEIDLALAIPDDMWIFFHNHFLFPGLGESQQLTHGLHSSSCYDGHSAFLSDVG